MIRVLPIAALQFLALASIAAPELEAQRRTKEEAAYLKRIFDRSDSNKDGQIVGDEFPGSDDQFKAVDRNRNRKIDFKEWDGSAMANDLIAAQRANREAPRPRQNKDRLLFQRLKLIFRADPNNNGKITKKEWRGTESDFQALDLDRDGQIDKGDLALAERAARASDPELPDIDRRFPPYEELMKKLDRDKDGRLDRKEVRKDDLAQAFDYADMDADGKLDKGEIERVIRTVRERIEQRNRGDSRPTAWRPPFSAWDKNKDGRLETAEWIERKYLFPRFDQNRDAAVTEVEVERYARSVEGTTFIERFDLNDDGRVTLEEFGGPPGAFRRADTDGDGFVTKRDR